MPRKKAKAEAHEDKPSSRRKAAKLKIRRHDDEPPRRSTARAVAHRNAAPAGSAAPAESAPPAESLRNAAPAPAAEETPMTDDTTESSDERTPISERLKNFDGSHVAAGIAAGTVGQIIGVAIVGQGWISPKVTAGAMMGIGTATTAAGYFWESDHTMAAGAGLTAAGTFALANQYAVDAYEAVEQRSQEKKAKKAEKETNQLPAQKPAGQRNAGPQLTLVREDNDQPAA